jgi:hypothetical protein
VRSPTPSWKKLFNKIPGCGVPPIVNLFGIYAACGMPHSRSDPMGVMKIVSVSLRIGAVAELVGIEVGVVSGVINLESSGVEASDWRLRHEATYHEA